MPSGAQIDRPFSGRPSVAPDAAPLFTCRGPPTPAVGCVTRTQPRARPISRTQGWDRTRPFGRWSHARPGQNLAQGNPNSMPDDHAPGQIPGRLSGTPHGNATSGPPVRRPAPRSRTPNPSPRRSAGADPHGTRAPADSTLAAPLAAPARFCAR
ncbi:hypothetical protein FPZ47_04405 [Mycobacterium helveticum]|uniref:Uncharacterized protein n=1 Tax=Mycobacterium helveticum TaxID=2592811 RepID=A0A557XZ92_9MYCO|nr:hypothetical protein FPZ46_08715 [Mycobacterium helveticum]TVS91549.1 hypothetical protein FPZ47_04405 [Mycobacterium helveticum]